jgi:hypothetical protein
MPTVQEDSQCIINAINERACHALGLGRPADRAKNPPSAHKHEPGAQRSSAGQRATGPLLLTPSPSARQQRPPYMSPPTEQGR